MKAACRKRLLRMRSRPRDKPASLNHVVRFLLFAWGGEDTEEFFAPFERAAGGVVVREYSQRSAQVTAGFGDVAQLQAADAYALHRAVMVRIQGKGALGISE